MNEPKDEHLDPLLNEAIGPRRPSQELFTRITDLTDSPMCDLLDRAIGPDHAPCDEDKLVRSILNATTDRPAVIGRISPVRTAWRIAAMVSICTGLSMIVCRLCNLTTRFQRMRLL